MPAQVSVTEQLQRLYALANREGLYDAADWLHAAMQSRQQEHTERKRVTVLEQGIKDFLAPYPPPGDPGSHADECGESSIGVVCDCGATDARYTALQSLISE